MNEAGVNETRLLGALSWKTKQGQELVPHSSPNVQHHPVPSSCWLARQGSACTSFIPSRGCVAFLSCKEDSLRLQNWSSDCHTPLASVVSQPHLWMSASSGNTMTTDPKWPQKQLGRAVRKCSGGARPGEPRQKCAGCPEIYEELIQSQGGGDLEGPQPMALGSHPPANDFCEPGTVLSFCHMLSHYTFTETQRRGIALTTTFYR